MATTLRVKRRTSGAGGAPSSLKSGEIAYNNMDGTLYIGFGDTGDGTATSVKAFAKDNYVDPAGVYQPLNTQLTALAGLTGTGITVRTGSNTFAQRQLASGSSSRIAISNGDGTSGNPTIDLATVTVGGTVTGGSTKFTVDSYGRISNAGQASLSDLSAPSASFNMNGQKLTSLADPTQAQDAATKNYVDNAITGLDPKASVLCATTAAITLSGEQTIDGVTTSNSRVLVKNQGGPLQNGIYVSGAGAWVRADDANTWNELVSAYVFVEKGAVHGDQGWLCTSDAGGTLETTAVNWVQFSGTGAGGGFTIAGAGLTGTGSTIDVAAGTGISTAGDVVGLTGQALALHNVTTAADKLIYATGSGAFATTDLTSTGRTLIGGANAGAMRTTLGVAIGSDVQAYNARLNSLAGLAISTADNIVLYGASNAAAALTLGATGKLLLSAANQASAQTTLGLGTMSTQSANAVAITGGTIDGVTLDGGTF